MLAYIIQRLAESALVLLIMSFVVYGLIGLMPGDPIDIMISANPDLTPADGARLRALYGLDRPIGERYLNWLGAALQGDFGYSRLHTRPVLEILMPRLGNTVILIEHHLDMIKNSDWLIDLGPLAGERGGELVAQGTPEYVASVKKSATGQYLRRMDGIKPDVKAPGTTRPRKFKTSVNGKVVDEITLPVRPASSPNGATRSRRNSRRWRRRRRGAATAG